MIGVDSMNIPTILVPLDGSKFAECSDQEPEAGNRQA
jgi:hypothetical protein